MRLALHAAPNGMALTVRAAGTVPSLTVRCYWQRPRARFGWDLYWHLPWLDVGLVLVW